MTNFTINDRRKAATRGEPGGAATQPESRDVSEPTLNLLGHRDNGDPLAAHTWADFKGQEGLKRELQLHINSAIKRKEPLGHVLLTGPPGVGKTTIGYLIAKQMGGGFEEVPAPFSENLLIDTCMRMRSGDVLFIDEIHEVARRKGCTEALLPVLIGWRSRFNEPLPRITIVGATTDPDRLAEPMLDRFHIRPYFDGYTLAAMRDIIDAMALKLGVEMDPRLRHYLAKASNGTPRLAGNLVRAARVVADSGETVTPERVLRLAGVTEDGLTRKHIEYMSVLYNNPRYVGGKIRYRMGFTNIPRLMHAPKETVERLERTLIEKGYILLESTGRELTLKAVKMMKEASD